MKEQKNIPKLRFPEFKGEWEKKKLGEVANKIGDGLHGTPIYSDNSDIYFINGNNLTNGKIEINENTKKVDLSIFEKNNKRLNQNTILLSINGTIGNIAKYNNEKVMLGKSVGYFNFEGNTDFYFYILHTDTIQNYFISELTGSTIKNLSLKTLRETEISFPTLSEQKRIASFFTVLDKKIAEIKQKKNLLEQYKKGLMQRLFLSDLGLVGLEDDRIDDDDDKNENPTIVKSKKSKFRQLRFKDDTSTPLSAGNGKEFPKWEKKKLGEVFYCEKGKGISKNKIVIDGKYECVLYGELYTKYNEVIFEVVSKTNEDDGTKSKIGDLLIPSSTTTTGIDLANVTALNKENVLLGGDITILRSNEKTNNVFYAYYLSNHKNEEIASYAQGSTIVHLYYSHIKDMPIDIPCLAEQTKIANFLSAIDEKINRTENQLQQTQQYKKGLLQQMFC